MANVNVEYNRIASRKEIFGVKCEEDVLGVLANYRKILCAFLVEGGLLNDDTAELAKYPEELDRIARPEFIEVPIHDENGKLTEDTELEVACIYVPMLAFPGQNLQALKMLMDEYRQKEVNGEVVDIKITIESDPEHRSFIVVHNPEIEYAEEEEDKE